MDTTDASFSESAPTTNVDAAGSSAGALASSPRGGYAPPVPPAPPKRRMVITHDKFVQLQSLIVLHLAQVERTTGDGLTKEDLIDWYLESKEDEMADVGVAEYERELIAKMLRKLVKVSVRRSPPRRKCQHFPTGQLPDRDPWGCTTVASALTGREWGTIP
jgi:DNA replication licensing factor MCM6